MLIAIILGLLVVGFGIFAFVVVKAMIFMFIGVGIVYAVTYVGMDQYFGPENLLYSIIGTAVVGTALLAFISYVMQTSSNLADNGQKITTRNPNQVYVPNSRTVNVAFGVTYSLFTVLFGYAFLDFGFKPIGALVSGLLFSSIATLVVFKIWRKI